MEFTEKNIEALKTALMPVIGRFTNDVREINVILRKSFNGEDYLDITTNNIRMTPCVFSALSIQGEAKTYKDEHENEMLWVMLSWRWESFGGGSNGTELATVWMRKGLSGYSVSEINLN